MTKKRRYSSSRRQFVKTAVTAAIASAAPGTVFPTIVPASVLNGKGPSNRINVGAIGNGRISRGHDLPGVWKYETAQIVAVCDLDNTRLQQAKQLVNEYYGKKTGKTYTE